DGPNCCWPVPGPHWPPGSPAWPPPGHRPRCACSPGSTARGGGPTQDCCCCRRAARADRRPRGCFARPPRSRLTWTCLAPVRRYRHACWRGGSPPPPGGPPGRTAPRPGAGAPRHRRVTALARAQGWLAEALRADAAGDRRRLLAACGRGLAILDEHQLTLGASELRAQATAHGAELAALAQRSALAAARPRLLL